MIASPELEFANVSDVGRRRPQNEDSAVTDTESGFALVADGMGGYKAGEVASAIAAKVVFDGVREGCRKHQFLRENAAMDEARESRLLRTMIEQANQLIFETAQKIPECQGMGTTIVTALFTPDRVIIAHVGDSRIYRLREGELKQMTSDHSLLQELIDRGFFSPAEAAASAPKNMVTRALGIDESVEVDVQELRTRPDDIYLLCSDGLNDMVSDEGIHLTLSKYSANLLEAAHALVGLANDEGGKDNISVVLARPGTSRTRSAGRSSIFQSLRSRGS